MDSSSPKKYVAKRKQKNEYYLSRLCFIAGAAEIHQRQDEMADDEHYYHHKTPSATHHHQSALLHLLGAHLANKQSTSTSSALSPHFPPFNDSSMQRTFQLQHLARHSATTSRPTDGNSSHQTASTPTGCTFSAGPQCPHCGKIYSNSSNLRQHVRNVHMPIDQSLWHRCPTCSKRLKTKHYLINHQLQAHGIHQRGATSGISGVE